MTDLDDRLDAPKAWADRKATLSASMAGFDGLILCVQGLIIGESLATGGVPEYGDVESTLAHARRLLGDIHALVQAWGVQQ